MATNPAIYDKEVVFARLNSSSKTYTVFRFDGRSWAIRSSTVRNVGPFDPLIPQHQCKMAVVQHLTTIPHQLFPHNVALQRIISPAMQARLHADGVILGCRALRESEQPLSVGLHPKCAVSTVSPCAHSSRTLDRTPYISVIGVNIDNYQHTTSKLVDYRNNATSANPPWVMIDLAAAYGHVFDPLLDDPTGNCRRQPLSFHNISNWDEQLIEGFIPPAAILCYVPNGGPTAELLGFVAQACARGRRPAPMAVVAEVEELGARRRIAASCARELAQLVQDSENSVRSRIKKERRAFMRALEATAVAFAATTSLCETLVEGHRVAVKALFKESKAAVKEKKRNVKIWTCQGNNHRFGCQCRTIGPHMVVVTVETANDLGVPYWEV